MSDPIDVSSLTDSSEGATDSFAVRVSELAADFLWLDNHEVRGFLAALQKKYGDRFEALSIFHDPIHKLEYHNVLDAMASSEIELVASELDAFAKQKSSRLELQEEERYAEEQALTMVEVRRLFQELDAEDEFTPEQLTRAYERCLNSETLPIKVEEILETSFRQKVFSQASVENLVIMQLVLGVPEPLVERDLKKFDFYLEKVESRLREEVTPLIDCWLSYILRRAYERQKDRLSYPPPARFILETLLKEGLNKHACIYYILLDRAKGTEQLIIESIAEIQGKAVSEVASAYTRVFRTLPDAGLPSFGSRKLEGFELDREQLEGGELGGLLPPSGQQGLLVRLASKRSFALQAEDTALAPEIKPGDVLFFDPEQSPAGGDLVLASYALADEAPRCVVRRYIAGSDFAQLLPDRLASGIEALVFQRDETGSWQLQGQPARLRIEAVAVGVLRRFHSDRCDGVG